MSFQHQGPRRCEKISLWNFLLYSIFYEVELINPAVQGTLGMLNSALKYGCVSLPCVYISRLTVVTKRSQVQRIVVTSSCAAVLSLPLSKPTVFSEQDWNLASEKEVEELGNKCNAGAPYCASKKLSEKGGFFTYLVFRSSDLTWRFSCNQRPGIFMSSTSLRLNGIWWLLSLHMSVFIYLYYKFIGNC